MDVMESGPQDLSAGALLLEQLWGNSAAIVKYGQALIIELKEHFYNLTDNLIE